MSQADCVSTADSPVFICRHCGGMLRVLFYEAGDRFVCGVCGAAMIKTDYTLSDDEGHLMYGNEPDDLQFQEKLFEKYVRGSGEFDIKAFAQRMGSARRKRRG